MTKLSKILGSIALCSALGLGASTASASVWGPFGGHNWDNWGPWNNGYNNGWGRSWGGSWSPWDNGFNNGWGRSWGGSWTPWDNGWGNGWGNNWGPGYYGRGYPYPPQAPYYPPQNLPAEPPAPDQQ